MTAPGTAPAAAARRRNRLLLARLAGEIPRVSLTLGTELVVRASA